MHSFVKVLYRKDSKEVCKEMFGDAMLDAQDRELQRRIAVFMFWSKNLSLKEHPSWRSLRWLELVSSRGFG